MRTQTKVLIAAVLLFLLILLLRIPSPDHGPKPTPLGHAGRRIWLGLYNENQNRIALSQKEIWPSAATWGAKTSTEFLRTCIVSNILKDVTFEDFRGPGLPKPAPTNAADFTASNNAWCVTLNCDSSTPPETPFLFSRNFCQTIGRRGQGPVYGHSLRDIKTLCPRTKPFGSERGVVITFGGSMKIVSGKAIARNSQRYFNPLGVDLPFLHP